MTASPWWSGPIAETISPWRKPMRTETLPAPAMKDARELVEVGNPVQHRRSADELDRAAQAAAVLRARLDLAELLQKQAEADEHLADGAGFGRNSSAPALSASWRVSQSSRFERDTMRNSAQETVGAHARAQTHAALVGKSPTSVITSHGRRATARRSASRLAPWTAKPWRSRQSATSRRCFGLGVDDEAQRRAGGVAPNGRGSACASTASVSRASAAGSTTSRNAVARLSTRPLVRSGRGHVVDDGEAA